MPASSERSSRSVVRLCRHYTILPARQGARKAPGPGPNLPLPYFACPPLLPQRGPPLSRLCRKLERQGPDRVPWCGPPLLRPHTAPGPRPRSGGGWEWREEEEWGEGAQVPPGRRCLIPPHGEAREQALSSAPLPQATMFKEPPTRWGATCPTHWRGLQAQQANRRGLTTHMVRAVAPLPPDPSLPGSGTDRLTWPQQISAPPPPADTGRRTKAPLHHLRAAAPWQERCDPLGLPGGPSADHMLKSQTRAWAPHKGPWSAVHLHCSSTHRAPIRAQERLGAAGLTGRMTEGLPCTNTETQEVP
ncbi:hypothetical protein NDU88_006254 [Pleurodeles waltl]|uniref:Uncharacterized protein n=1 Tax=Pleurodeles waltl TaxID=8319 RepID=A0AAV7WX30_PLEWA|nr:hypothetical protein NDU88_006254 [Pleurodeles waltl]